MLLTASPRPTHAPAPIAAFNLDIVGDSRRYGNGLVDNVIPDFVCDEFVKILVGIEHFDNEVARSSIRPRKVDV